MSSLKKKFFFINSHEDALRTWQKSLGPCCNTERWPLPWALFVCTVSTVNAISVPSNDPVEHYPNQHVSPRQQNIPKQTLFSCFNLTQHQPELNKDCWVQTAVWKLLLVQNQHNGTCYCTTLQKKKAPKCHFMKLQCLKHQLKYKFSPSEGQSFSAVGRWRGCQSEASAKRCSPRRSSWWRCRNTARDCGLFRVCQPH